MKRFKTTNFLVKVSSLVLLWRAFCHLLIILSYHQASNQTSICILQNLQHTLMRAYVRLYPYLHTAWEGLLLIYYLRYLFGTSNCHSPLLALSRVSLRLKGIDDQQVEQSYGWIDILYQG